MLTKAQKLKRIQDLVDRGNPAFKTDYGHSLQINKQNDNGIIDVSLLNEEGEVESGCEICVWDGNGDLMLVDLGNGDRRIIDNTPHTLFAILYV